MNIFAVYKPNTGGLVRVWSRSWRKHGFSPKLLGPFEITHRGSVRKALRARRGKRIIPLELINFGLRPKGFTNRTRAKVYPALGWESAKLVMFPSGSTEADIVKFSELHDPC